MAPGREGSRNIQQTSCFSASYNLQVSFQTNLHKSEVLSGSHHINIGWLDISVLLWTHLVRKYLEVEALNVSMETGPIPPNYFGAYFPAWLLAHFTRSSSRLREASAALDDMSLRKIAVAKRLGKVFSMGIRERLFEEEGYTWPPPSREAKKERVEDCSRLSEFFFSLYCCCAVHDSYKAAPKLMFHVWCDTFFFSFYFTFQILLLDIFFFPLLISSSELVFSFRHSNCKVILDFFLLLKNVMIINSCTSL